MTTDFSPIGTKTRNWCRPVSDLGYIAPTPIQSRVIPLMLEGHDVIGQAQTGTGKNGCFRATYYSKHGTRSARHTGSGIGSHTGIGHAGSEGGQ